MLCRDQNKINNWRLTGYQDFITIFSKEGMGTASRRVGNVHIDFVSFSAALTVLQTPTCLSLHQTKEFT